MLYTEFLNGIDRSDSEAMQHAYKVMNGRYMEDGFDTKEDVYIFFNRWEHSTFNWIDDLCIGKGKKAKNSCKTGITEEEAIIIINGLFCFESDKIQICGAAYYEATDLNFIRFEVNGYRRVFCDDTLWDIWD